MAGASGTPRVGGGALVLALLLAGACSPGPKKPDPADLQAARQAALAFDGQLRTTVLDRLDRGDDPLAVYTAYRDTVRTLTLNAARKAAAPLGLVAALPDPPRDPEAPAAVEAPAPDPGARADTGARAGPAFFFKRTADRVRNRANAPDDWELRQMENFQYWLDAGVDENTLDVSEIVKEGGQTWFRWMRPIMMTEDCLTCHGEAISDPILTRLGQDYPDDEGTGYFEGDLAGAYSVKIALPDRKR